MKREIITICGSYRFTKRMIEVQKNLTELGFIVLMPAINCDIHNKEWYLDLHYDKIAMSDYIFVVDIGGYIGEHTTLEIKKARELNKGIIYYSQAERNCYGISLTVFKDSGV